jgi:hypothetical protein
VEPEQGGVTLHSPDDGIGRHAALKMQCRKAYGFKSRSGYMAKNINVLTRVESVDQASKMVGYPGNPDQVFISFSALWSAVQEAENIPVPPGAIATIEFQKHGGLKLNTIRITWEK